MRNLTVSTLNLIAAILFLACSTTSKKTFTAHSQASKPQTNLQVTSETGAITKTAAGMKQVPLAIAADAEYAAFFARLVLLENDYTEKDRQILLKIPAAPSGGTIHEAALVVGLLRDVLTPIGVASKSTYSEPTAARMDTHTYKGLQTPTTAAKFGNSRVIELRTQTAGVDLIGALTSNPYLKGRSVYKMAFEALLLGGNSPIFAENLRSTLQTESASWGQFANQLSGKNDLKAQANTSASSDAIPTAQETTILSLNTQNSGSQAGATADAMASDSAVLLAKAQELASKDLIEQAITTARLVPENSETYSVAKQNIKTWSDRATQDLRKQAANQYRASSSTPDSNGKKVYLSKARTLLEEALAKYPESSNLETIKENLEIINQELNRLE